MSALSAARMSDDDPTAGGHDHDLAQAVLRGEAGAADELGRRLTCVDRVLRARNGRAGGPLTQPELDDVAQDVRIVAWQRLATLHPGTTLLSWVYGICELQLRNAVRKKRRQPRPSDVDPDATTRALGGEPDFFEDVYDCLGRLDAVDQRILQHKHFDGWTLDEIARRLGMNLNTVKSRYARSLGRLRSCLFRREGEQETG